MDQAEIARIKYEERIRVATIFSKWLQRMATSFSAQGFTAEAKVTTYLCGKSVEVLDILKTDDILSQQGVPVGPALVGYEQPPAAGVVIGGPGSTQAASE